MGEIPENVIKTKTTMKLALVGSLSSYVAFRSRLLLGNAGTLESGLI